MVMQGQIGPSGLSAQALMQLVGAIPPGGGGFGGVAPVAGGGFGNVPSHGGPGGGFGGFQNVPPPAPPLGGGGFQNIPPPAPPLGGGFGGISPLGALGAPPPGPPIGGGFGNVPPPGPPVGGGFGGIAPAPGGGFGNVPSHGGFGNVPPPAPPLGGGLIPPPAPPLGGRRRIIGQRRVNGQLVPIVEGEGVAPQGGGQGFQGVPPPAPPLAGGQVPPPAPPLGQGVGNVSPQGALGNAPTSQGGGFSNVPPPAPPLGGGLGGEQTAVAPAGGGGGFSVPSSFGVPLTSPGAGGSPLGFGGGDLEQRLTQAFPGLGQLGFSVPQGASFGQPTPFRDFFGNQGLPNLGDAFQAGPDAGQIIGSVGAATGTSQPEQARQSGSVTPRTARLGRF